MTPARRRDAALRRNQAHSRCLVRYHTGAPRLSFGGDDRPSAMRRNRALLLALALALSRSLSRGPRPGVSFGLSSAVRRFGTRAPSRVGGRPARSIVPVRSSRALIRHASLPHGPFSIPAGPTTRPRDACSTSAPTRPSAARAPPSNRRSSARWSRASRSSRPASTRPTAARPTQRRARARLAPTAGIGARGCRRPRRSSGRRCCRAGSPRGGVGGGPERR